MNKENTMDEFEKYLEKHITDMANYPEENGGRSMLKMALHEYRTFKARHKEDEQLAVLADKHNYSVEIHNNDGADGSYWNIVLSSADMNPSDWKLIEEMSYKKAEAAARKFLEGLPDAKKEKGGE